EPKITISIDSTLPVGCCAPSTYIGGVPKNIIIDGAFADWNDVHEFIDSDHESIVNPNVDINTYKIYQDIDKLSFFFQVKGELLGGTSVSIKPNIIYKPVEIIDTDDDGVPDEIDPNPNQYNDSDFDNWSDDYEDVISKTDKYNWDTDGDNYSDSEDVAPLDPTIPPIPEHISYMDGNDSAMIFIDADQNVRTGFVIKEPRIGADYMLRVRGKYGYILNSSLFEFNGSNPYEIKNFLFVKNIVVGTDAKCLETAVNLNDLNLNIGSSVDVVFFIHDWDSYSSDASDGILDSLVGLKNTQKQIIILNPVSYPDSGEWYVNFLTTGTGTLIIGNYSFPKDVEFKGLYYLSPAQRLYYRVPVELDMVNQCVNADWRYKIGLAIFEPKTEDEQLIRIDFGNNEYAIMNASNESRAEWIYQINSGDYSNFSRFSSLALRGSRAPPQETKSQYLLNDGSSDMMN
ncbi:MAG: hypothetical protein KAJ51_12605, partial [Thermoplasmata archaeon]|nr:hypothetical protein [Thermoplasmata archaeon]